MGALCLTTMAKIAHLLIAICVLLVGSPPNAELIHSKRRHAPRDLASNHQDPSSKLKKFVFAPIATTRGSFDQLSALGNRAIAPKINPGSRVIPMPIRGRGVSLPHHALSPSKTQHSRQAPSMFFDTAHKHEFSGRRSISPATPTHVSPTETLIDSPTTETKIGPQLPGLKANQLSLLEIGELGALFSDASYVGTTGTQITEPEKIEPEIQQFLDSHLGEEAKFAPVVKGVFMNRELDTMMYAATAEVTMHGKRGRHKACVLCFRGTKGSLFDPNWRNNFRSFMLEDDKPAGMKDSYFSLRDHVIDLVKKAAGLEGEPDLNKLQEALPGGVIVVGHSLGGVMATYAMLDILDTINDERHLFNSDAPDHFDEGYFRLLTFGQPRDFSLSSANKFQERLWDIKTRFVVEGDLVPSSPVPLMQGKKTLPAENRFSHTGRAIFLDHHVPETPHDVTAYSARDAGLDMDFTGEKPSSAFALAIKAGVNPIEFHLTPHYLEALEGARKALGDTRKLFVLPKHERRLEQAAVV